MVFNYRYLIMQFLLEFQMLFLLQILCFTFILFSCIITNYYNLSRTGKKFWNLFHLQPMRDQKVILDSCYRINKSPFNQALTSFRYFLLIPFYLFQGELQYFIGVQLDGSDHMEPLRNRLSEKTELQSAKLVYIFHITCIFLL